MVVAWLSPASATRRSERGVSYQVLGFSVRTPRWRGTSRATSYRKAVDNRDKFEETQPHLTPESQYSDTIIVPSSPRN